MWGGAVGSTILLTIAPHCPGVHSPAIADSWLGLGLVHIQSLQDPEVLRVLSTTPDVETVI